MSLLVRRRLMLAASRHPNDGKFCYAIRTNGALYYSVNYGATFTKTGLTPGVTARLAVDNTGKATCITAEGIMMTVTPNAAGTDITTDASVRTDMGDAQSICVGSGSIALHYAVNSGTDWTTGFTTLIKRSVNAGSPVTRKTFNTWDQAAESASACSTDGKYALIGGKTGYTNAFYTNDYGSHWAECLATQSYGNGTRAVAVSGTGRTAISVTSTGYSVSTDYLATWKTKGSGTTYHCCDITGNDGYGQGAAFVNKGSNLYRCPINADGTLGSWKNITSDITFTIIRTNYYGTRCIGRTSTGAIYYSNNGGHTWAETNLSGWVEVVMNKNWI